MKGQQGWMKNREKFSKAVREEKMSGVEVNAARVNECSLCGGVVLSCMKQG